MADDAITQGCIGGLGSLVYICGANENYLSHRHPNFGFSNIFLQIQANPQKYLKDL